ncbi:hypothetical protein V1520DRAFT_349202 [Lipomyces starkeyi]|uniref:Secreted protein n=1 Tax=Lipomyces starkeyi NRRL Y-11557 TaxID=675824 RepID=A0A1E3QEV5_LIPST|nr:hypothetical protein LIPSTDRAFT_67114 [Lipomyces starkeyi NRRL Y-11557]
MLGASIHMFTLIVLLSVRVHSLYSIIHSVTKHYAYFTSRFMTHPMIRVHTSHLTDDISFVLRSSFTQSSSLYVPLFGPTFICMNTHAST